MFDPKATASHLDSTTSGITRAEHNESALPGAADIRADVAQGLRRANCRRAGRPAQNINRELVSDREVRGCRGVKMRCGLSAVAVHTRSLGKERRKKIWDTAG